MDLNLKNKNAIVCGSTQGIGKAIAVELANLGATVTLIARNKEKLETVMQELTNKDGQHHDFLIADFSNPSQLKETVEQYILQQKKTIHILINNTGGPAGGPIEDAKIEEFTQTFSNHLICNHILVQATKEGMKKSGYGRIINIISTSVKQPLNGLGVSNTIRGAVANWSKTLANELGQYGITVNNVLPGATDTVRLKSIIENKATKTGQSINELAQNMANEVPLKRIGKPEEIANAVAFLASPAAAYISGINLPVDGGRTKSL
ncbi:MAG: short-chain dehydrogenase [Flavobacteriales bacterium CG18_big_fil_WC_8_21_14_2_50_32_9]|nr:SDR family oxidoreductase [Flavobacteriales bacterium]PIQ14779.1 MAG: short-chain dehydrogenase [Flavobacteriales bacterium CG18_big_fil_WC_8_21_14_2_50_32_9]PJC61538.1 MAG: short-chain dehydrogenase [Flavobacteriales bacterium CG_4_9_14_0_2_um_filter_32_27]